MLLRGSMTSASTGSGTGARPRRPTSKMRRRSRRKKIADSRHGIRRQADITFRTFAATYIADCAEQHKRSVDRDREILKVLNRAFGSLILHEITARRIEQFKRERLAGKWRGHGQPRAGHAALCVL